MASLHHLERPLPDTRRPKLELRHGAASWSEYLVVGQSATGRVRLRSIETGEEHVADLAKEEYRWID